jgi:protein-S-isoprenylcysteine O-methyltransferase Ste14
MDIKLQTIIYFSYLYGFFEIFMSVRQRLKRKQEIVKSGDKLSIWILFIFIGIGYFFSFRIGFTAFGRIYHWNSFFAIGAILTIFGLLIRIISILTLKQHFTYTVTKIDNHELIDTGLYKNVRHPGYLGQLIIFFGISIALSNWISMILMMLPVIIGYLNRIRVEEKFLIEQMGQKYLDYQKHTKRLIPMIY